MKNAIILHGMPSKEEYYSPKYPSASNFQWLPWLQKQLLIADIHAVTPEMPHAYLPDYAMWKREFERYDIVSSTVLVGHSCGAGFLVRWLSENTVHVGRVLLVAPWLDPDKELDTGFFDFTIDTKLSDRAEEVFLINSLDDDDDIQKSVKLIRSSIEKVTYVEFADRGHFLTSEFPELAAKILETQ